MDYVFSKWQLLFQSDFAPFSCILILIIFIKTNSSFSDRVNRLFLLACVCSFLLVISDNTRFITAHMDKPCFLRYLSAAIGYSLRPAIVYLIAEIFGRREKNRIKYLELPLIICILVSFISMFKFGKGIMFSFTDSNVFVHGPLGYLPHIVSIIYGILIVKFAFRNVKNNGKELIVVVVLLLTGTFATYMESKFKFDFILSHVFVLGIAFYYFFLLVQTLKRDTLTGLLNRRCFYLEINHNLKNKMIFLSMDLNNLKIYNDTYGHAFGDKAIVAVSEIMDQLFSKKSKLYRIGGDEFMCIFYNSEEKEVLELVENFQKQLLKTEYRVACGVAEYTPKDDVEKIITLSDKRMYENKEMLKKQK